MSGEFSFTTFHRADVTGIGQGILLFVQEQNRRDLGELVCVEIGFEERSVRLLPTGKIQNMSGGKIDAHARSLVAAANPTAGYARLSEGLKGEPMR